MTLAAGQGKTMVYLLAAMILNKHDEKKFKNFLFLTTTIALKK
jgi:Rad3-related DNA helicase